MDKLTEHINQLTFMVNKLNKDVKAITYVNHLLTEIMFESNPQFKILAADILEQTAENSDIDNDKFFEILESLLKCSRSPTKLTSAARRKWIHLVSQSESD